MFQSELSPTYCEGIFTSSAQSYGHEGIQCWMVSVQGDTDGMKVWRVSSLLTSFLLLSPFLPVLPWFLHFRWWYSGTPLICSLNRPQKSDHIKVVLWRKLHLFIYAILIKRKVDYFNIFEYFFSLQRYSSF